MTNCIECKKSGLKDQKKDQSTRLIVQKQPITVRLTGTYLLKKFNNRMSTLGKESSSKDILFIRVVKRVNADV